VQDYESPRFLSYFPKLIILHGGTATGFHHVTAPPPLNLFNLYHISASKPSSTGQKPAHLIVRQVSSGYRKCIERYPADVFVLDRGTEVWQYNTKHSIGKEKFKAAEFVRTILDARKNEPTLQVFDEGGSGASRFISELAEEDDTEDEDSALPTPADSTPSSPKLFRMSDAQGQISFTAVNTPSPTISDLDGSDAFLLDNSTDHDVPAVYAWVGGQASPVERKYAVQYAQQYLWSLSSGGKKARSRTSIVRLNQGHESNHFLQALA